MKTLQIFVPARLSEDRKQLVIDLSRMPRDDRECVERMEAELEKEHKSWQRIQLSPPAKAASRGFRSQMAHIHGHGADIALQEANPYLQSKENVLHCLACKAIERGFPSEDIGGILVPKPLGMLDTFEANLLIEAEHQYADEKNYWLHEYDESQKKPRVYRTRGGRTLAEMMKQEPELNPEYAEEFAIA